MEGNRVRQRLREISPWRLYTHASHITIASFENSEGCICTGPSLIQLRLPFTSTPITTTANCNTRATASIAFTTTCL